MKIDQKIQDLEEQNARLHKSLKDTINHIRTDADELFQKIGRDDGFTFVFIDCHMDTLKSIKSMIDSNQEKIELLRSIY